MTPILYCIIGISIYSPGITQTYELDPMDFVEYNLSVSTEAEDLCWSLSGELPDLAWAEGIDLEDEDMDPNDCSRGIDESNQSTCQEEL